MSRRRALESAAMHSSTCAWLVTKRQEWSPSRRELDFMNPITLVLTPLFHQGIYDSVIERPRRRSSVNSLNRAARAAQRSANRPRRLALLPAAPLGAVVAASGGTAPGLPTELPLSPEEDPSMHTTERPTPAMN